MRIDERQSGILLGQQGSKLALAPDAKTKAPDLGPACRRFEGFLLGELFKQMREGETGGQGIIPVTRAESIFVRQQCEMLGDLMAQREPLGLARMLSTQAARKQNAALGLTPSATRTGGNTDAG